MVYYRQKRLEKYKKNSSDLDTCEVNPGAMFIFYAQTKYIKHLYCYCVIFGSYSISYYQSAIVKHVFLVISCIGNCYLLLWLSISFKFKFDTDIVFIPYSSCTKFLHQKNKHISLHFLNH